MLKRKSISILVSVVLAFNSLFFIVHAQDEPTDDLNYLDAVYFFRGMYGLMQEEVNSPYTVTCTQSGTNWCTIYTVTQGSSITNLAETFNIFSVPNGGSWATYSAYSSSKRIRVSTDPLYIVFLSSTNFTTSNVTLYTQSGYSTSFTRVTGSTQTVMTPAGYYLIVLKLWATNQHSQGYNFVTVNMPGSTSTKIIPISYGVESTMSDNVHRLVFGTGQTYTVNDPNTQAKLNTIHTDITNTNTKLDTLNTKINTANDHLYGLVQNTNTMSIQLTNIRSDLNTLINGTTTSTTTVNNNDQQNTTLTDSISDLVDQEDSFMTSMDSALQGVNLNNAIITDNNFLNSANWVRTQFNTMINNNPFGSLLYLCLSLGFALLIIGKIK